MNRSDINVTPIKEYKLIHQNKCSYQLALEALPEEEQTNSPSIMGPAYFKARGITMYNATKTRHLIGECSCSWRDEDFIKASLSKTIERRVLIFDFERSAGTVQKRFFSRGDLKDGYIFLSDVVEEPKTEMISYKWLGEDEVHTISSWNYETREEFAWAVYNLFIQATDVIAHNGGRADFPWYKELFWWEFQLPALPLIREIDTMNLAREIGAPYKSLNDLAKRFGHIGKTDKYRIEAMDNAIAGDKKERTRMEAYCEGDVIALEYIFEYLSTRSKRKFNFNPVKAATQFICDKCSSTKLTKVGYVAPSTRIYAQYKCDDCGAYNRSAKPVKIVKS